MALLTREEVEAAVAGLLEVDPGTLGGGDDLVMLGLDSIGVMTLVNDWRARGLDVTFGDLLERPTLDDWALLLTGGADAPASGDGAESAGAAEFALSPMQHAYWIGRSDGIALGGNGSHFYFEFDGRVTDRARLERAVTALVRRHPMLRAVFGDDGTQRLGDPSGVAVTSRDWRERPAHELPAALEHLRAELSHRKLDVASGEVFDVQLTLLPEGRSRVHVDVDMMVCDAASFRVLLADLARFHAGEPHEPGGPDGPGGLDGPGEPGEPGGPGGPGEPRGPGGIGTTFRDHLRARSERTASDRSVRYWTERVPDLPDGPGLPAAREVAAVRRPRNGRRHAWLDPRRKDVLARRAREGGVTLSMALLAAFGEVLRGWSDRPRFLITLPVFDRDPADPALAGVIGDFTDLLLHEADLREPATFAARAADTQRRFSRDMSHADFPGTSVLREIARARGTTTPVAPVVFTSALSLGELFGPGVRAALGDPVWMSSETPQVALDVQVVEHDGGILVNWESADELFPPGVQDAMFDAYTSLLETLEDPGAWQRPAGIEPPAAQLGVRRAAERAAPGGDPDCLHEAFFELARTEPGRTAVVGAAGEVLRYGDLAGRALRLAGSLREHGVRDGDAVAVHLPRGAGQVVAVLGVLAAGGCYVPVGTGQPDERRRRIHRGAGVRAVVSEASDPVARETGAASVRLADGLAAEPLGAPRQVSPDQVAYVIHTSGSTGEPKGVEVSHRAAGTTITALAEHFGLGAGDRTLAVSALDFDLSVFDLFGPLRTGGAVVCVPDEAARDAAAWRDLCTTHHVTVLNCVPAVLDMLLVAAGEEGPGPLRAVLLGGDRVRADLPGRLRAVAPGCRFAGLGGTTETAIHSTICEVEDEVPAEWSIVPYGRPLPGQRCRVVGPYGEDRPDWVTGELWIGGGGVAEGYRGDPGRTADRFVERDGVRWYRTGDLARYRPDGSLDFLGRADVQLKIYGYRVEPAEVEAALVAYPGVTAAAVVAVPVAGGSRLAALIAGPGLPDDTGPLREFLGRRLPGYLVPDRIVATDALPLSANGKIDRAAAAGRIVRDDAGQAAFEAPRGEIETAVADLWEELLGTGPVGRTDGFFAAGGDSLQATRLMVRLRAAGLHGAGLPELFAAPVLKDFAARLSRGERTRAHVLRADPAGRHEPFPATDVQRAYWLGRSADFTLGGVGSHWYWEFEGADVDLDRLQRIWNRLVRRHEMLRAVFDENGDQRILPRVPPFAFTVEDAGPDLPAALDAQRRRMAHRVFDPARWPLFDVGAVRHDGGTRLAFSFDYIVLDALSIMIIFSELAALYQDERAQLPPVGVSFRDYVRHLETVPADEEDREFWARRAAELPAAPALPLAVAPEAVGAPRFSRREFVVDELRWQGILRRARAADLTPSTVLAAAYAEVLAAYSGGKDVTITLTLFDRRDVHPDVENIVGDFTSLLLAGHRPRPGRSWARAAREMQEQVWSGLQHSSYPAIGVLRDIARRSGTAQAVMPAVFTSTLGVSGRLASLDLPFGEYVCGLSQTPQVYLDCQVTQLPGGVAINWDAVDEVFPDGLLDRMFAAFHDLVDWASSADWDDPAPPLLTAAEAGARDLVNGTRRDTSGALLHDGFFATAAREPERVALITQDGTEIGYGTLAARALAVAGALAGLPGEPVVVCLPKGAGQIAAVLGVLASGRAYVPVGTDQPASRRERIIARAGACAIITDDLNAPDGNALDETGPDGPAVPVVRVGDALAHEPLAAPVLAGDDELAYVIFTSGSTGEPKGVEISHAAAVNTVEDVTERYGVGPGDRVLAVSALDFDLSVYDVFGLLAAGGSLVLVEETARREPRTWADLVRRHGVTVWNTVPALLEMLLTVTDDLPGLRLALLSGDWIGLTLPARLRKAAPGARFVALGGATEAAIWSNALEVGEVGADWPSIPYGYPLANQRYRVVDERGHDCPDLVPGELWIGGAGVARGYRGDPGLTARRFPLRDGERWYRTGDIGRYLPGGILEFLGRADHQVKIRGHRIELGEIEAALTGLPGVTAAVVVAPGERTDRRLVAFVVGDTDGGDGVDGGDGGGRGEGAVGVEDADGVRLRERLTALLPGHMVPERIERLGSLPLSANGKVDRSALEASAARGTARPSEPPRGELERELAAMWADLLDVEPGAVGRHDSVFTAGADSLLVTRATEILRSRFGAAVSVRRMFDTPTVAGLAALIEDPDTEEGAL